MVPPKPHPANVPGDFYVEENCCLRCEVPFVTAPELFAWQDSEEGQCIVKHQPDNPAELSHMLEVLVGQDAGCIRYRGSNRLQQERLVSDGLGELCDNLPPDLQNKVDRERRADERSRWRTELIVRFFRWLLRIPKDN